MAIPSSAPPPSYSNLFPNNDFPTEKIQSGPKLAENQQILADLQQ